MHLEENSYTLILVKPGTVLLYEGGKGGKRGGKEERGRGRRRREEKGEGGEGRKEETFKRCSKNCSLLTLAPMGTNTNNGVS